MKTRKTILIGMALVLGLGGLTATAARMNWMDALGLRSPERAVRQRMEGYWKARVAGDLKAQAPYLHPLQKAAQDNSLLRTERFEIVSVKVEGEEAIAEVKAHYRLKHPKLAKTERDLTIQDKWVRYKGEWYHGLHPVGLGEVLRHGLGKWKPPVEPTP